MKARLSLMAAMVLGALGLASEARADRCYGGYYGGYHRPIYRTYCAPVRYCGYGYRPVYRHYYPRRVVHLSGGYGYPYNGGYYGAGYGYPYGGLSFGVSLGGHHHHSYHRGYHGHYRGYCR